MSSRYRRVQCECAQVIYAPPKSNAKSHTFCIARGAWTCHASPKSLQKVENSPFSGLILILIMWRYSKKLTLILLSNRTKDGMTARKVKIVQTDPHFSDCSTEAIPRSHRCSFSADGCLQVDILGDEYVLSNLHELGVDLVDIERK